MFTVTVFLAMAFQQTVDVGSFSERTFEKEGGYVGENGTLFYVTKHLIHGWNKDFDKVIEIEIRDKTIEGFYAADQYILASQIGPNAELKTVILDFQGTVLGELAVFGTQFQKLNGQLYTFRLDLRPPYIDVPYPFQYQPLEVFKIENDFDFRDDGQPLFKFTPYLAKFQFDFKDSWGVYTDGKYYFVNEIEPKIWISSLTEAIREQKEGASKPGTLSSIPLKLIGFNPILEPFKPSKSFYPTEEIQLIRWQWWARHSQIVGFQAYGDDFLIAYDYPQCNEDSGECQEPLLGLQILDDQFQPVGQPTTVSGLLLGTIGTKAYILQFEKPLTEKRPVGPFRAQILVLDSL